MGRLRVPLPFVLGLGFACTAVIAVWRGDFIVGLLAALGMIYVAMEWEELDS